MIVAVRVLLLLLHGPDGREILLNSDQVVSLNSGVPGKPNTAISDKIRCVINTSDGKFISVVEHCDAISGMMGKTND